jgi:acetoacetyl-CoA synthetase
MSTQPRTDRGPIIWVPSDERIEHAGVTQFIHWLGQHRGMVLDGYADLWKWSVDDLEGFWAAVWEFSGVISSQGWETVLSQPEMPGAVWFSGAKLNFAENALQRKDDEPLIFFHREDGLSRDLTACQLREQVASAASGLRSLGVRAGDCVAAVLPNCPEAIVAFLATASIGAIWTLCGPETGARAIVARFAQVKPTVLITVDGYVFSGKRLDIRKPVDEAVRSLPSLTRHVRVSYLDESTSPDAMSWEDLLRGDATLEFEPVAFDHPLWIVFSSGTTGPPKAIVHGHGGIVLEQLKVQNLHQSAPHGVRHVALTLASPSWIVWNLQVSYLLTGTTLVVYDGSPLFPNPSSVWAIAGQRGVSVLRASAGWIIACMKAGITPKKGNDLSALQTLLSTGSPLPVDAFHWIIEHVGQNVMPASSSGGTEVCTALVTAVAVLPIRAGEIQCKALGVAVDSFDPQGNSVVGEVGELVVKSPMPSMPLRFWDDAEGARLRSTYFTRYPGVWHHGDWIRLYEDGGSVILGRSDASLNRGGVRTGAAEYYGVLDGVSGVVDSLIVDVTSPGSASELLLFIVLSAGDSLDAELQERVRRALSTQLSPRHVPDRIIEAPDIPYTITGKKCEVPVKRILLGARPTDVADAGALRNPAVLTFYADFARSIHSEDPSTLA